MTTTQGWERDFDEKSGESVSEQGFLYDFAGCDDPCCGGCTVQVNGEEIKAFIRAEKKKSYEEGVTAEREKIHQQLLEARSDAAPFNRDPLKHAEILINQKRRHYP